MSKHRSFYLALALIAMLVVASAAHADRLKDLADVEGVRANQLIGYGLVVGLDGTGDQTSQARFTVQSLKSLLTQLGVTIPPDVNPQLKNVHCYSLRVKQKLHTYP